ncbi:GDSL esterase/lipase At5g55050, partial [Amborella trichopoda]|uniref:GDSL esterase/lipase At5g55050 n=1 Tax=Amborella trichopoda TaxID=13333 RepID=UPI0009BD88EA
FNSTDRINNSLFAAEKLGAPTSPPPYLSLSNIFNSFSSISNGVSFASGGAGILDGSSSKPLQECLSLNKQIEYYSAVYGDIVQQLGNNGSQVYLSKSLFALVIGSNDILGYFKPNSKLRSQISPENFIDNLILTLKGQLQRLYNLGARKMATVGVGPIGCCPAQRNQNNTGNCNQETNYWSQKYNEGLLSLLRGMKAQYQNFHFSFFHNYDAVLDFIENPAAHGFKEVKAACCGLGKFNAKVACLPISTYCSNRKDHVFWDLYHPTETVSHMLTDAFFDGSEPLVTPINIRQLLAM